MDRLDISYKAFECRKNLNLDNVSPIDIFSIVEEELSHITLILYPFSNSISGMYICSDDIKCIAINSNMSYGRQRFTLCHELYHYYFNSKESLIQLCSMKLNTKDENEINADNFASFLLAPYDSLKNKFYEVCKDNEPTIEQIIRLEQFYGISHQALLWRLNMDNLISKDTLQKLSLPHISQIAQAYGYSAKLYFPIEKKSIKKTFGAYIRDAKLIFDNGLITQGKYEEFLLQAYRSDLVYNESEENYRESDLGEE